jgi:hypothetical protein
MKNLLAILALFLAGPAFSVTTCTSAVKQIAVDLGGEQRLFVVLATGPTLSLPTQGGDVYKIVDSMAMMSHTIGQPVTVTFAGDFACPGGGVRKDALRVSVGE